MQVDASSFWMVIATPMPKILETILESPKKRYGILQDRLIVCEKKQDL